MKTYDATDVNKAFHHLNQGRILESELHVILLFVRAYQPSRLSLIDRFPVRTDLLVLEVVTADHHKHAFEDIEELGGTIGHDGIVLDNRAVPHKILVFFVVNSKP